MDKQTHLLKLCIEMAFTAHRDKFSQTPVTTIRNNCEKLVHLADYIIQVCFLKISLKIYLEFIRRILKIR